MTRTYRVFLLAEDDDNKTYDIEAADHYKAITIAMDKAFEETPKGRFMLDGFEEVDDKKERGRQ